MDLDFIHMPMQDVFKYREELKQQMQVLKDKQSLLNEELAIRFGNTARNKLNDDGKDYARITYAIDERKYNNAPPVIKGKLQEHRTVELTGTTVDITEDTNGS